MKLKKAPEILLTAGLFGVSALLSIRLFWELAGSDRLAAFLLAFVAVMFEGAKVFLWFWGIRRRALGAIVLAIVLVLLSLFASFASALAVVRSAGSGAKLQTRQLERSESELERLDREIAGLVSARDALPADYVKAREKYEGLIGPLRVERAQVLEKLEARENSQVERAQDASTSELFTAVGSVFASGPAAVILGEFIRMIYLVVVAATLEIVAMAMAYFEIQVERSGDPGAKLELVEDSGIVHARQGDRVLCGRVIKEPKVPGAGARPCPVCSMKALSVRLTNKSAV